MVLHDVFSTPPVQPAREGSQWRLVLAAPLDRLGAVIADFALIAPVLSVVLSLFRKSIVLAQLAGHTEGMLLQAGLASLVCLLVTAAYQAACLYFWGATLGKKFFSLQVVNVWTGQRPALASTLVLRSLAWCFEVVVGFCFPFLAVFSNDRRRPWHDRLADTVVVTLRPERAVGPPSFVEASPSLSLMAMYIAGMGLLFSIGVVELRHRVSDPHLVAEDLEGRARLCHEVSVANEEAWSSAPGNDSGLVSGSASGPVSGSASGRMETALALYESEQIGISCLRPEAQFAIWRDENRAAANFAFALIYAGEDDVSGQYIDKVCAGADTSIPCLALRLKFGEDEDGGGNVVTAAAAALRAQPALPWYARLILLKHYRSVNDFERALPLTEADDAPPTISAILLAERYKVLWQLGREGEAMSLAQGSLGLLPEARRFEMRKMLCDSEASRVCSAEAEKICAEFAHQMELSELLFTQSDLVVSYLVAKECSRDGLASVDEGRLPSAAGRGLLKAIRLAQRNKKSDARKEADLASRMVEQDSPFSSEALARRAMWSESVPELKELRSEWIRLSKNPGAERAGLAIIDRMLQLKDFESAHEAARLMRSALLGSRRLAQRLVTATNQVGDAKAKVVQRLPSSLKEAGQGGAKVSDEREHK